MTQASYALAGLLGAGTVSAAADIVQVGAASYRTDRPADAKGPPAIIRRTENVRGKMPSNDWWSSLAWTAESFALFPHPLAVKVEPGGLRIAYPGANITANKAAIFGSMPGGTNDFILGHSAQTTFPPGLVDGFSDWFVTVRFATNGNRLRVSFGHGSPFVYALYDGGSPSLMFAKPPQLWSGTAESSALGISVNGRHYGLFGPTGSSWRGIGSAALICDSAGRSYFAVAVLPDATEETLALFRKHAHAHVTDTRVEWRYDPAGSRVDSQFHFTTVAQEGSERGTLFALYPHQWRNTSNSLLRAAYKSVRGLMKLGQGTAFTTQMTFPGILPALPEVGGCKPERMAALVKPEVQLKSGPPKDTYWEGKQLGRLATLVPIAEQYGLTNETATLRDRMRVRLEAWFRSSDTDGESKSRGLFHYDTNWGTLIGYPASYGSDTELNDHHFHYGYFIKAAAEIARHDPDWASDKRWGGFVKLLIRDIVSPDRADPLFPFLRCFDPYAGHSWASGHAKFADGNNNESSSEAMNAWSGIILWAEATADRALRELGIYLFTTEMNAIQEYWFNVHGDNFPAGYPASVVTMVWGGKGANGTWFSADPQLVHGINFLPIHGASLYLGLYPDYVEKNYRALVAEHPGGDHFNNWPDVHWMYRALTDAPDAIRLFEASDPAQKLEDGNTRGNLVHWLYSLKLLGRPLGDVTADTPLRAVFQNDVTRNYIVYNAAPSARTVKFSDGQIVHSDGTGWFKATRNTPINPNQPR